MIGRARIVTAVLLLLITTDAWADNQLLDTAQASVDAGDLDTAAQVLAFGLASEPGNERARFLYARVLSWNGRLIAARAQYDVLLEANPNNADYLLGKAQVLVWSGQPEAALPVLARARDVAPDYAAVRKLEAQARRASAGAASTARPAAVGHLEGGFSWQTLSNDLPDWSSFYVDASRKLARGATLLGGLRQVDRFDQSDTEARAGVYWPIAGNWTLVTEGTIAPDADVLPEWSGFAELGVQIANSFGLRLGFRHRGYQTSDLDTLTLTADGYLDDFFAAWTIYASKLSGADVTLATQFRIDRYYGDASRVGLLVAAGEETESVGGGLFVTSDTVSLLVTGMHWLTPRWGLSWDIGIHQQGDAYDRGGVRVGLRRQF